MQILLGFFCLLVAEPSGLGESQIRSEWQELQTSGRSADSVENFMRRHFMLSISEDYFAKKLVNEKRSISASVYRDPHVAADDIAVSFSNHPLQIQEGVLAIFKFLGTADDRPIDSIGIFLSFLELVLIAGLMSFILIAITHLWLWAIPISHDIRIFKGSDITFRLFLIGCFLICLFLKVWIFGAFVFATAMMTYSRSALVGFAGWKIAFVLQLILFFGPSAKFAAEQLTALEALGLGRTRIEYSQRALEFLNPIEKAYWSTMNGDKTSARAWMQSSSDNADRKIFEAYLTAIDGGSRIGQAEFEKLDTELPNHPVVLYNLSQLNTVNQNLVAAERYREKIPAKSYESLSSRPQALGSPLIWGISRSPYGLWFSNFSDDVRARIEALPMLARIGCGIQIFLIPLLALFFGLAWRKRASGLCTQTGLSSPNLQSSESSLFQAAKSRSKGLISTQRQNVEIQQRAFSSLRSSFAKIWGWMVLSIQDILWNERPSVSFAFQWVLFFLLIIGVGTSMQSKLLEFCGLPQRMTLHPTGPLSMILGFAGLVFVWGLSRSYAKGNR